MRIPIRQQVTLSVGGKKFTTAHECPLHISTKGSLPHFIGLHGTDEGSILFEHTTYVGQNNEKLFIGAFQNDEQAYRCILHFLQDELPFLLWDY
jgi:hypothetical protein